MSKGDQDNTRKEALKDIVEEDLAASTKEELESWRISPGEVLESVGYTTGNLPTFRRMLRQAGLRLRGRTRAQYITRERES